MSFPLPKEALPPFPPFSSRLSAETFGTEDLAPFSFSFFFSPRARFCLRRMQSGPFPLRKFPPPPWIYSARLTVICSPSEYVKPFLEHFLGDPQQPAGFFFFFEPGQDDSSLFFLGHPFPNRRKKGPLLEKRRTFLASSDTFENRHFS